MRVFSDSETVRITVQDFGRGMPAEFVEKLFQRYAQSEAADASTRKGYGLGLNICKSIIEAHRGKINVSSKMGEGSTFTVFLPLTQGMSTKTSNSQTAPEKSLKDKKEAGDKTISPRFGQYLGLGNHFGAATGVRTAGLMLVAVPLLFQLIFALVLGILIHQQSNLLDGAFYRYQVVNGCRAILHSAIETGCSAFTFRTLHDKADFDQYLQSKNSTLRQLQSLWSIVKKEDITAVNELSRYTKVLMEKIDRLATQKAGDTRLGADYFLSSEGQEFIEEMIVKQNPILLFYKRRELLEKELPLTRKEYKGNIRLALILALTLDVVLTLVLLLLCNRAITKRIETVVRNTQRFREGHLLSEPLQGEDEIAQLDTAIHESSLKVKRLEEFKQAMISVVGHELRAPLASVQALFQLLEAGIMCEGSDQSRQGASHGQQKCEQLLELIENILDIERIGYGKMLIEPTLIDLTHLLAELGIEDSSASSMRINCDLPKLKRALVCIHNALRDIGFEDNKVSAIASKSERTILIKIRTTRPFDQDVDDVSLFDPFVEGASSVPRRTRIALQLAKSLIKLNEGSLVYKQLGDSDERISTFEIVITAW